MGKAGETAGAGAIYFTEQRHCAFRSPQFLSSCFLTPGSFFPRIDRVSRYRKGARSHRSTAVSAISGGAALDRVNPGGTGQIGVWLTNTKQAARSNQQLGTYTLTSVNFDFSLQNVDNSRERRRIELNPSAFFFFFFPMSLNDFPSFRDCAMRDR